MRNLWPWPIGLLGAAIYIALLWTNSGFGSESKLWMLAAQYVVLLPAFLIVLRWREPTAKPAAAESRLATVSILYLAATLVPAYVVRNGIYNADESAYRFQARVFRAGSLAAKAPPRTSPDEAVYQRDFFFEQHVIFDGRWFGKYPPGWPATLAMTDSIGASWLLNPLLGLVTLWITYAIGNRLFGAVVAQGSVVVLLLSPFFTLNCVGYMSHPVCGVAVAGAALLLLRGLESRRWSDFAGMFLLLAFAFVVRPWTAASVAVVIGVVLVMTLRREPARLATVLALGAVLGAAALAVMLIDNRALTGSPWISPYAAFHSTSVPIEISLQPASLLRNFKTITSVGLAKTVLHAFPFVFLLAAYGLWRDRSKWAWMLAALFLVLVAFYVPQVEVSDSVVGERYYYEAYFAVAILAAKGWSELRERWRPSRAAVGALLAAVVAVQIFHYGVIAQWIVAIKRGYPLAVAAAENLHLQHGLVLMKTGRGFRAKNFNPNQADWVNAPLFFVPDPGPDRRSILACTIQRPDWVLVGYDWSSRTAVIEDRGHEQCPRWP